MITRVKGTQDILDLKLHNFLLNVIREYFKAYHFMEIMIPVLEHSDLFIRSVGTETDIVSKEMYFVHSAHEKDTNLALRPEMTASTIRAFLNNKIQTTPWKVFTYGPVFRHERPQKGRYREFYQINMEIIGSTSPAQDAYFITMLDRLFSEKLSLENYGLLINFIGCHNDRERYKEALKKYIDKHEAELCDTCKERKEKNILRVLDCKNPNDKALFAKGPKITDYLCEQCDSEWKLIQQLLSQLSVSYTLAPMLVRGLDYYNKIVFEFVAVDGLGSQNTFCGGGRYDTLASQIGGAKDYPSIGASIGVERLVMLLEPIADQLPIQSLKPLQVIVPLSDDQVPLALQLADELHAQNLRCDIVLDGGSIKSLMKKADAMQAANAIIIGSDEQAGLFATVKNMTTGTSEKVPQRNLVDFLKKSNTINHS